MSRKIRAGQADRRFVVEEVIFVLKEETRDKESVQLRSTYANNLDSSHRPQEFDDEVSALGAHSPQFNIFGKSFLLGVAQNKSSNPFPIQKYPQRQKSNFYSFKWNMASFDGAPPLRLGLHRYPVKKNDEPGSEIGGKPLANPGLPEITKIFK